MVSDGLMTLATIVTVAMTLLLLASGPIYADAITLASMRKELYCR